MSGGLRKTRRKLRSRASFSSGVPGSVIATKCEPSGVRAQNCSMWEFVSSVVPDLLAITYSVSSGGSSSVTRATAAGCVVSSTTSSSAPSAAPYVRANTSGARLDPPIPHSTAVRKPSDAAFFAKASRSGTCSSIVSITVSQPSRSVISVGSGFHSVWS